jgi:acyl-CoA thioesterase-1
MEEPNFLLRWTIFAFGGGDAAIWGALGIAAIAILSLYPGRKRPARPLFVAAVIAVSLFFIACASPPTPIWFVLFLTPFTWLLTALAIELPFHFWFAPTTPISTLLVIGDSVTAGLNDGEDTWPRQLSRASAVEVLDASQPGATLRSARKQNALLANRSGLVILEIGGNDMLEGLPVAQFENDLDQLLNSVFQLERTVVMFELPLPPLCAAYGAAQRRQAARHRVKLIPKRLFASVLTRRGATVDGIHLSAQGQTQMMAMIQSLVGDLLQIGSGKYQRFDR